MTTPAAAIRRDYAAALRAHLAAPGEASLDAGYELGRRALVEAVSILDLVEVHFTAVQGADRGTADAALGFLLQTLTALDIATRGYLDGARRYREQRERADDLADRDAFRRALVDSLQDGFFVADGDNTVVEVNAAFGEITGYGPDGLPYAWPHPWADAPARLPDILRDEGRITVPARHRDGRRIWLALSANSLSALPGHEGWSVGTVRDVTAERTLVQRERAVNQLATSIAGAAGVAEVLRAGLVHCRPALDAVDAVAAAWPDATGEPVVFDMVGVPSRAWRDLDDEVHEALERARREPDLPIATVPLIERIRGIGLPVGPGAAMWLEFPAPRRVGPDDRALIGLFAGHLRVAMLRARAYDDVRTVSLTLQQSMLGAEAPPRGIAVRYEPAVAPLEIGGDWYDVVTLPDGRVGVVVGDCVGRGLSAAAVMGQLRTSSRALMLRGAGPAQLLDDLDTVAAHIPGAACATVCAAIIDPADGTVRYSSAGHPPAIVAAPGVPIRLLDRGRSVPLATADLGPRPEAETVLEPGGLYLVYTDGLVERRGTVIDTGIDTAARALADAAGRTADEVADLVLDASAPPGGYDDDVALVVFRRPPARFRLDLSAVDTELATARGMLSDWLAEAEAPAALAADVVLAVNEACTNSVEHGYRDRAPAGVVITAELAASGIDVTIADSGSWRPPPADRGSRGRGTAMMVALSDAHTVEPSPTGTVVRLHWNPPRDQPDTVDGSVVRSGRLHGRLGPMPTDSVDNSSPTEALTTSTRAHGATTVVSVRGSVDLATAPILQAAVDAALADGPAQLVVDLSAVDFLASAGMAILVEAHRRLAGTGRLAVVAEGAATSRPIVLTGLDQVFELYPTLAEALAGVG